MIDGHVCFCKYIKACAKTWTGLWTVDCFLGEPGDIDINS